MTQLQLSKEILIEDQACILIRDVVGTSPDDKYTGHKEDGYQIWYEEKVLAEVKELNPNIKVYGVWQTLIRSGLVKSDEVLQVVYVNDNKDYGHYIYISNGDVQSGTVYNGLLQGLTSDADKNVTIESASIIDASISSLSLPKEWLMTKREQSKALITKQQATKKRNIIVAVAIVVAAIGWDSFNQYQYKTHQDKFFEEVSQLDRLKATIENLSLTRLNFKPEQSGFISHIHKVSASLEGSIISAEINLLSMVDPSIKVEVNEFNERILLSLVERGFLVEMKPSHANVSWAVK